MDITDSSLVESKKLNPKQTLELLKQTYLKPRAIITEHELSIATTTFYIVQCISTKVFTWTYLVTFTHLLT